MAEARSKNGEAKVRPLNGLRFRTNDAPLVVYSNFVMDLTNEICDLFPALDKKTMMERNAIIFDDDSLILFRLIRFRLNGSEDLVCDFVHGTVEQWQFPLIEIALNRAKSINDILFRYHVIMDKIKGKFDNEITMAYINRIEKDIDNMTITSSRTKRYILNTKKYKNAIFGSDRYLYVIEFYMNKGLRFSISSVFGSVPDNDGSILRFNDIDVLYNGIIKDPTDIHVFLVNLFYHGEIDDVFRYNNIAENDSVPDYNKYASPEQLSKVKLWAESFVEQKRDENGELIT
jgi:hypothetical protein